LAGGIVAAIIGQVEKKLKMRVHYFVLRKDWCNFASRKQKVGKNPHKTTKPEQE